MPIIPKWRNYFNQLFYQSPTVTITGDTGIIATPYFVNGGQAINPICFVAIGTNMTTDETNDLTIAWYADAAGNGGIIGTTTFNQLTASALTDIEGWPGDVTFDDSGRGIVPLLPFMKITHTLAGTDKSMAYTIKISYLKLDA